MAKQLSGQLKHFQLFSFALVQIVPKQNFKHCKDTINIYVQRYIAYKSHSTFQTKLEKVYRAINKYIYGVLSCINQTYTEDKGIYAYMYNWEYY